MLLKRRCYCTLLWWEAENGKQLPIAYGRYNGPIQVMQKHGQDCIISNCNQVGRHRLYPGHYSGIFITSENNKMQKPSISQGLYPILLLASLALMTSTYTSLSVSQDLNPQCQLRKASVYHSATSAVMTLQSST